VAEFSEEKFASAFHRRRFLQTATAAAGGALLPQSVWAQTAQVRPAATPYDLRDDGGKNYITAVKDQEDPVPCNACTAFAVAAAVEGTFNKKNLISGTPTAPPPGPDLDEMEFFLRQSTGPDDIGSGGCGTSHWWPKYALARCQAAGMKQQGATQPLKILGFTNLLSESLSTARQNLKKTQDDMKCWIRSKGPVVAVIVQYEDLYAWGKAWNEQHPGTANTNAYAPGKFLSLCAGATPPRKRPRIDIVGGHVVAIVGYDNDNWICKNSWGSDWNGDGYVLIEQTGPGGTGHLGVDSCYIDLIDVWGVYFDNPNVTCP
jgi:hypothetical protein